MMERIFYYDYKNGEIVKNWFQQKSDYPNDTLHVVNEQGWISYDKNTVTGKVCGRYDDWSRTQYYNVKTFFRKKKLLKESLIKECEESILEYNEIMNSHLDKLRKL